MKCRKRERRRRKEFISQLDGEGEKEDREMGEE